ncbi:unnamed protein product [Lathyrus oleraceus]|uniref:Uncharacterized protein n=2 Tax=Pisum sativum TaxID=3888 RepID=A0A9D5AH99_PEA|nr:uncharacterized protein LOC127086289 [Pisum sativum]KAI5411802.1 hypothetical protein KIW84_056755 [Pisum sativum]
MGKSSTSLKKKHSKISSKSKSSSRSKNRKSKSKKVRRHEVSLSSSDYEDSKNMDISVSSSSEDRSKRKRDRSRTRKDVKSRKKRLRRRSCSSDSSEDSLFARKRKKVKRKNKYDETREKSRRKKKVKTEASVNSVSSGSRSCSICPAGIDSNDNVEYERSRGRTERKEKDKRQLRGRSGSAKSSRYRARSCSPCSSPHGECNYGGTEEKYVPENKTRWLRSVITVVNEGDESRQLSGNETKEEIVDDLDYPCRSNDSNDHGSNRELDHHQSHRAPEEELRAKDDTGDVNGDVNFTEPKLSGMSSLEVCAGTNESIKEETNDVSGVLNDVDLELILRQRALENLRKFRGQVQSHAKASEQENKIVSQMKQPITEKEELVQDKPNISNVAILATKFGKQTPVEETSLPVGRRNLVTYPKIDGGNLNVDKEMSGSAKIQMASAPEKVVDADSHSEVVTTPPESCNDSLQSRSSLKQTIVSGLPREKLVLAESIKNEGTFEAARITSHCGSDNVKDIKGVPSAGPKSSTLEPKFKHNNLDKGKDVANDHSQFKSKQTSDSREPSNATLPVSEADEERNAAKTTQSSIQNIDGSARDIVESCNVATLESVENNSGKLQEGSNQGSQFEQKTMTVMRGGELVQVSYKVYIPKKTPALARRQLKR